MHNINFFSFSQKMYTDFELQGVIDDKLNSKTYQTVASRMQTEEATCALSMSQADEYVRLKLNRTLALVFSLSQPPANQWC